jgi:hypothetical protein
VRPDVKLFAYARNYRYGGWRAVRADRSPPLIQSLSSRKVVASGRFTVALLACMTLAACGHDADQTAAATMTTRASPRPAAVARATASRGAGTRAAARRQARSLERLLAYMIRELSIRRGATDDQLFDGREWRSDDMRCWPCNLGPGVAAAVMWRRSKLDRARNGRLATQTFEGMLDQHQQADGSFGTAPATGDQTTLFASVELATATLELQPLLTRDQLRRWRTALAKAADFVWSKFGDYYVNGNINVAVVVLMELTQRITGKPRFRSYASQGLRFALRPPQDRWRGFGLQLTTSPTRADDSDGAGYFAEKGAGKPGFDPEYTTLQAMFLTRLYELAPSARVLRLMNLVFNSLRPRVDTSTFQLRTDGGTRHPQSGRNVPFLSPVLSALAFQGGRADLLSLVPQQLARIAYEMRHSLTYSYGNMYRALGAEVATALQAARPRAAGGA